jgi:hypothetical protein
MSHQLGEVFDDHPSYVTNKGIQMTLPLVPWPEVGGRRKRTYPKTHFTQVKHTAKFGIKQLPAADEDPKSFEDENRFVAVLNCGGGTGIILVRLPGKDQFARVESGKLMRLEQPLNIDPTEMRTTYIRQSIRLSQNRHSSRMHAFHMSYRNHIHGHERRFRSGPRAYFGL